jgi:hypothetical protein
MRARHGGSLSSTLGLETSSSIAFKLKQNNVPVVWESDSRDELSKPYRKGHLVSKPSTAATLLGSLMAAYLASHGLKPERLAADTAYGSAATLDWIVNEKGIAPHTGVRQVEARGRHLLTGRLHLRQGAQHLYLPGEQGAHHDRQNRE